MVPPPPSPEALLERARRARALARALLADQASAEDVAQDAVVASLGHGPGDELRPGWLSAKVRSLASRTHRGRARRARREAAAARPEAAPSAAELVERAWLQRTLVEAVVALDEPYRSALLLRYFEDLPPREIARLQGVGVRTVQTHLARGLTHLRGRLDRTLGPRTWAALAAPFTPPPAPAVPPAAAGPTAPTPLALAAGGILVQTKLKLVAAAGAAVVVGVLAVVFRSGADPAAPGGAPRVAAPVLVAVDSRAVDAPPALAEVDPAPRGEPVQPAPEGNAPRRATDPDPIDRERDLFGEVVDSAGRPVPCAEVSAQLHRAGGAVARPSCRGGRRAGSAAPRPDGRGAVPLRLEPGPLYRLVVEHPATRTVRLPERFAGERVRVVLGAAASVYGRVLRAADGSPVAGASLLLKSRAGGTARRTETYATESDLVGAYLLKGLPAGTYDVIVRCLADPDVWADGMVLAAGEALERDVLVPAGLTLTGHVLDASTGLALEGAEVGRSWNLGGAVRTDRTGRFQLHGLDPRDASMTVAARLPGYATVELDLQRGQELPDDLELMLEPELRAVGRILDPTGRPLAGAWVEAYGKASDPNVDWTASHVANVDRARAPSGADGRFELAGLSRRARHSLVVRSRGAGTLVVDFPDPEPERELVDLGDLALNLPASLRGRVVDRQGRPVPRARVFLEGGDAGRGRLALAPSPEVGSYTTRQERRVDDLGRFSAIDLGPGTYHLDAICAGVADWAQTSLELREGEQREGVELVLDVGSDENVIAGRVVGPDGAALARVHVEAYQPGDLRGDQPVMRGNLSTGLDGTFRLEGLVPGLYVIKAAPEPPSSLQAQDLAPLRLEGVATGRLDLVLELPPCATIRGRVLRADGSPADFCLVQIDHGESSVGGALAVATDAQGRFELPAAAGARVDLVACDYGVGKLARARDIVAGSEGLVLALEP